MEKNATHVSVRLDIKSSKLLARFQSIVESLQGIIVKDPQEPGLPDVIIMEIGSDFKKDFELIESMRRSPSCPPFFLTSSVTSAEVLKHALRMGIREFFLEPIEEAEVQTAFARIKEYVTERPKKAKYGKVISIVGSRGGIGSTVIAVNLTVSLVQSGEVTSVVLTDLNLQSGDTPLFLDIEPVHTIAQVSQNVSRLDPVFLMSTLIKHSSGIYILPPPNNLQDAELVTADSIETILHLMREMFDYIVVDASRSLDPITVAALNLSEMIFLVTQLDLPALRNAKRFVDIFLSLGYDQSKTELIINRYEKRSDVSLEEAEEVLEQKAFWLVPNDYTSVMSSINQGKSVILMAHNSKVTKSLKDLALTIQGKQPLRTEKRGFISGLMK